MSSPYTDRFGHPLTAAQTLARMNSPKSAGYYNAQGRWVKRRPKPAPTNEFIHDDEVTDRLRAERDITGK